MSGGSSSFLRSIKAVAWSFLGVRKNSEFQEDMASITPLHVLADRKSVV